MGSRRITTRSASWNGRMDNGHSNGNGRPAACSYISNVRPETRSTFCSVMAQLTEETQPSFETTLKSRAVSENCNVKFSCVVTGHPVPQVTWYKDDVQMDRYCGLPKYEIFRNGQSHTLHIYNCTVEDAAIYQASAINTKGIVSCSGVLEVGEMNEFKIHQRYFAKLKQKAQQRCKEVEGKENQELLRTISPDRTQRKRRSTMEGLLSSPGSQEEVSEESLRSLAVKSESDVRLQPAATEGTDEQKPVMNGQDMNESGNKGGSFIHDAAQKMFSSLQPKLPFVKKKIKISNKAMFSKPEPQNEKSTEEKQPKDGPPAARSYKHRVKTTETSDVKMEVEQIPGPRTVETRVRTQQKTASSDVTVPTPVERRPKDERARVVSPKTAAAAASKPQGVSGAKEEPAKRLEAKVGPKGPGEHWTKKQHSVSDLNTPSSRPPRHTLSKQKSLREDIMDKDIKSAVMDVEVRTETSAGGSLQSRNHRSEDGRSEGETSSEQTRDQLTETQPVPSSETKTNDAAVDLDFPSSTSESNTLQTKKTEPETCRDNTQRPSSRRGVPPAIITATEDKKDGSWKTDESHTALFTNTQTSELGGLGKSKVKSNLMESSNQGTKMQVDEKEESTFLLSGTAKTEAPNQEVEMETETAAEEVDDQVKTEAEASCNEKNVKLSKKAEDGPFKTQILEANVSDTTKTSPEQTGDLIEIPKPVSKVISVAELLRSQIKALELTLAKSAPAPPEACQGSRTDDGKNDLKTSTPERTINDEAPPTNIKATLMEVYHLINKDPVLSQTLLRVPDLLTPVVKETTDTGQDSGTLPLVPSEIRPAVVVNGIDQPVFPPTTCKNVLVQEILPVSDLPEISPKSGDLLKVSVEELDGTKQPQHEPSPGPSPSPSHQPSPRPSHEPSPSPSHQPSHEPSPSPSHQPSHEPSPGPSHQPSHELSPSPSHESSPGPSHEPSNELSPSPSHESSPGPSHQPSHELSPGSSHEPSHESSRGPSHEPSPGPSHEPSHEPSPGPSHQPSPGPSHQPSPGPSHQPSPDPSHELSQVKKEDEIQTFTPEIISNDKANSDLDLHEVEEPGRKTVPLTMELKLSPPSVSSSDLQQNQNPSQPDSVSVVELSVGPTPEASPLLKKRNCVSPLPSATPQELASGARRKILTCKTKSEDVTEAPAPVENQDQKKELPVQSSRLSVSPNVTPSTSPSLARRSALLQPPAGRASPVEKRSPLLNRRKTTLETPNQESTEKTLNLQTEEKPPEKTRNDPFKAPQVIRKIRGESFGDASGHLKLWCQFFNVLSDSMIKWYKNEEEITQVKRTAGDETPVNLAVVQASSRDTGVYGCVITNEYGTDATDTLLSADILAGMSLREDIGVGEEIEMMPLMFNKGVADCGVWGNKFFGRIMIQESHIGDGCSHKVWRAKVIYGLEPVFESGHTCIIKVRNPITYGGKGEGGLVERNLDIIKQDCRVQNLAREYCKIFSAEARAIENFGPTLDVLPVYMIYRPANTVPYATVEADLAGVYQKYCDLGQAGRTHVRTGSVVEQKCCALQHWIYQWTSGNLLLTRLEGVDTKITNVGLSVKTTGHHCVSAEGNPKVFEHFVSQHQCNYFCGLLGLRSLKVTESLLTPSKQKVSKSPLLQRKMAAGSSSPQMGRKAAGSPRVPRKSDPEGSKTPPKEKASEQT